jgi:UDPglucose 6-dehydrogenase/UDP-N-acetyl-D-galactosamine dehydrogenase
MPKHVAMLTIKALNDVKKVIHGSSVLIMGLTFKENVEDTRETPVKEIIKELKEFSCVLYGYDPLLSEQDVLGFDVKIFDKSRVKVDCVIFTVAHEPFKRMGLENIKNFMKESPILIDVRGIFNKNEAEEKGFYYKTL